MSGPGSPNFSDSGGNPLVSSTLPTAADAYVNATGYIYDASGRLIQTTYADGSFTTTHYATGTGQVDYTLDSLGHKTAYLYDGFGRQTDVIRDPDGINQTNHTDYDANGNVGCQHRWQWAYYLL